MVQWAMNEPVAVRILSRLPFSRSKPSRAAYCGLKTQNVLAVSSFASIGIIVSRSDESQTSIVMPSASLRYLSFRRKQGSNYSQPASHKWLEVFLNERYERKFYALGPRLGEDRLRVITGAN